jgi:hypothetical protein
MWKRKLNIKVTQKTHGTLTNSKLQVIHAHEHKTHQQLK